MRRLVRGDLSEAAAHPGLEAGSLEVARGVLRQRARVERVLQVLQGECELEDVRV